MILTQLQDYTIYLSCQKAKGSTEKKKFQVLSTFLIFLSLRFMLHQLLRKMEDLKSRCFALLHTAG